MLQDSCQFSEGDVNNNCGEEVPFSFYVVVCFVWILKLQCMKLKMSLIGSSTMSLLTSSTLWRLILLAFLLNTGELELKFYDLKMTVVIIL